jgi:rhodanese-related sulfurtransferase
MNHISAAELAIWLSDPVRTQPLLLDVREPWEYDTCRIDGSMLMPMATVPARQEELDPETPVVCICHHGARSMQVGAFLERVGFPNVTNLSGGIHGWAVQVDSSMPTY